MATEEFIPFIIKELGDRVGAAAGRAVAAGKGKPENQILLRLSLWELRQQDRKK